MRPIYRSTAVLGAVLALAACAVPPPSGPTVMALPGEGKSFEAFQQEDQYCRGYAFQMSGGQQAAQAGTDRAVGTAVVGTAVGAGLGAALGSLSGQMGAGAAIGGAAGALVGTSAGAGSAQASAGGQQQQYDVSYTQCMYSKGDSVQSSPPSGYAGGYGYPAYGYPAYAGGYYGGPAVVGPTVVIGGGGWGGGYGYRGGYGGGYRGGYGGYGYRR
jgi:hypothetical protein